MKINPRYTLKQYVCVYICECVRVYMCVYMQKHPELNISEEGITKSTLTKAERQLKDKFDGRPTKPPP